MEKIIKFNARFNYQYYDEDGKWIRTDRLIELLAEALGIEIVEEGNGTEYNRAQRVQ